MAGSSKATEVKGGVPAGIMVDFFEIDAKSNFDDPKKMVRKNNGFLKSEILTCWFALNVI